VQSRIVTSEVLLSLQPNRFSMYLHSVSVTCSRSSQERCSLGNCWLGNGPDKPNSCPLPQPRRSSRPLQWSCHLWSPSSMVADVREGRSGRSISLGVPAYQQQIGSFRRHNSW
jgi:hypothetical protein